MDFKKEIKETRKQLIHNTTQEVINVLNLTNEQVSVILSKNIWTISKKKNQTQNQNYTVKDLKQISSHMDVQLRSIIDKRKEIVDFLSFIENN